MHRPDEGAFGYLGNALQPFAHFIRGFVGEGQGEHSKMFARAREEASDTLREHACLSRTRAGDDEQCPVVVVYDFLLGSG